MNCIVHYNEVKQKVIETAKKVGRNPEDILLLPVSKTVGKEEILESPIARKIYLGEEFRM